MESRLALPPQESSEAPAIRDKCDDADEIAVEKGDSVVAAGAVGCVVVVGDDIGEPDEDESNSTGL